MSKPNPARFGLVPLADRILWSTCLRVGLVAASLLLWSLHSGSARPGDPSAVATATGLYAVVVLGTALSPRGGRSLAIAAVNASLVLDGLFLGAVFWATGGLAGPVPALLVVHVSAVSLLTSFRSGTKVALWHSLVVLVVINAERADWLPRWAGAPSTTRDYAAFLVVLWAAALATATFAAINERELRRRRYDAEVLHGLASQLEAVHEPPAIVELLAVLATEELLGRRAVVLVQPRSSATALGRLEVTTPAAARRSRGAQAEIPADPPGSLLRRASEAGDAQLARSLDGLRDAWLAQQLPDARNVVALPLPLDGEVDGWLAVDLGPKHGKGVERRLLSTLTQACAHVGLALSRAELVARLRRAAQTDGLTGVANRRAFDEAMRREVLRAERSGAPLAVALVDLDHFKSINDTHGHAAGDDALKGAAAALQTTARAGDLVARYGGEEFAVILTGTTPAQAVEAVERFRRAVATADTGVPVTCSIGVAALPRGEADPEEQPGEGAVQAAIAALLADTDAALYQAKETGRDRCVLAPLREVVPTS
ncbi:diguanylate cyclase (GGDEF)-like protein [Motilibacter rhizosphaerae]|uniref:Diguanylate cyclase (GGDEF)-like protein n=1 Tax=Motilibacter rhizosphaerae TaxID=598652 RepID=A0A4V2F2S2_9ACTN|nr:GGDEF domain-containing protein [Motilibacter rhizosphaerae]RZS79446.1 diguanylate cyclase (GGDEF)-like protein [Motilibacter rhizosphaerae]